FATIGIGILALAVADVVQQKTADSLLLGLWVFGTFFFAAVMNWSITSRTFLPMAPAVVILLLRRCKTFAHHNGLTLWWPLLPAALVSMLITTADCTLTDNAHLPQKSFQTRFRTHPGRVWM